jgi:Ran GTPase-activating protein (RanGAP) involved in mRNA processing and transport
MNGIKVNNCIVRLDLESNDITVKGGEIIFSSLINQNSIIYLNLNSLEGINRNRVTAEGVRLLENVLKTNLFLEFVYLSGNSIKNEGLRYILLGLNNNSTLHILDVSNNDINHIGIKYFSINYIY